MGQGHSVSSTPTYSARDQSLQVAPTAELLARRETLQRLDLSGNELNERMLSSLAGLRALRHLTLARCGIMSLPPWACTLPSLERLDLSHNRLERLDPVITEAKALQCLVLSNNRLEALPVGSLCAMPRLLMVLIDGNSIDIATLADTLADGSTFERDLFHGSAQQRVPQEVLPNVWLGSRYAAGLEPTAESPGVSRKAVADALTRRGVTHILTLGGRMPPAFPLFTYCIIEALEDTETADITSYFARALDFIDEALGNGGGVLVHCSQGQSRSATIVAAYVARQRLCGADEAIAFVKSKRYVVVPNEGFVKALREWCNREGGGS